MAKIKFDDPLKLDKDDLTRETINEVLMNTLNKFVPLIESKQRKQAMQLLPELLYYYELKKQVTTLTIKERLYIKTLTGLYKIRNNAQAIKQVQEKANEKIKKLLHKKRKGE